jgi:hypothetical protein
LKTSVSKIRVVVWERNHAFLMNISAFQFWKHLPAQVNINVMAAQYIWGLLVLPVSS